MTAVVVAV